MWPLHFSREYTGPATALQHWRRLVGRLPTSRAAPLHDPPSTPTTEEEEVNHPLIAQYNHATELNQKIKQLQDEYAQLSAAIARLTKGVFDENFAGDPLFASGDLEFQLLPDPYGQLSQISNMVAGLVRVPDDVIKDQIRLDACLTALIFPGENAAWLTAFNEAAYAADRDIPSIKAAIDATLKTHGEPMYPTSDSN